MTSQPETKQQTEVAGKSRKRLKPLLQKLLNDNSVPGLCWRDRGRQIWQMPWKHHKQTRWGDPDALMLRELAKGLYNYQGPDAPAQESLKHWKELLRNALRSLDDVDELKDLQVVDSEKPYKVYQFLEQPVRARRCRGMTLCQPRDTERRLKRVPTATVQCNNLAPTFLGPLDASDLLEHGPSHNGPPATISTRSQFCGIMFQGNSPQQVGVHSARNEEHYAIPQSDHCGSMLANQVLCRIEDGHIFPGNLADSVDDDVLNKLMSEFNLSSFRSRSPLRPSSESDLNIQEISVKDIDILNNRPHSTPGVSDSAVPATVNNQLKISSFAGSQRCAGASRSADVTPRKMTGNSDYEDAMNTGFHDSVGMFHRLENPRNAASPVSGIQNLAVESQSYLLEHAEPMAMDHHCRTSPSIRDNPTLSSETYQSSYPSINSILGNAPVPSVCVAVYYNTYQVVKWQILTRPFRICFVPDEETRESIMTCQDPKQFGPTDVDLFELPEISGDTGLSLQARDTKKVLNNLTRGMIVELRDKNIYATRYCKAVPHFCTPGHTEFTKMERHQDVQIFDFCDYFRNSFEPQYRYQTVNPHVRLSFAVRDANRKAAALSVDLWHTEAHQRKLQAGQNAHSLEADCSLSDEYDRRVEIEQLLRKAQLHF